MKVNAEGRFKNPNQKFSKNEKGKKRSYFT